MPAGAVRSLLEQDPAIRRQDFYPVPSFGTSYCRFNCQPIARGQPNPLADPRVRRALTMVIDKQDLVDNVTGLHQKVARTFIPPGLTVSDPSGATFEYRQPQGLPYDVPAARKLLAEAGYPGGAGLGEIRLAYKTDPSRTAIPQRLAETWGRQLGVRVVLDALDTSAFGGSLKKPDNKDWHAVLLAWFGDYRDPSTFLEMFVSGDGNNDSGYANPSYDALMTQAAATGDQARRMELFNQAEQMAIVRDAAIAPLYYYQEPFMVRPWVQGAWPNVMGMTFLKQVWINR